MAGRPQGGNQGGILVGMIVSVVVALIALVLLVLLWTKQEDLQIAAESARTDAERVMRPQELQGALRPWYDQAVGRQSVAGNMNDTIVRLVELITTDENPGRPGIAREVQDRVDGFWDSLRADGLLSDVTDVTGKPLLEALRTLYQRYTDQHDQLAQARTRVEQLDESVTSLTAANQELQTRFAEKAQELEQTVAQVEEARDRFRSEKEQQFREIENQLEQRANEQLAKEQQARDTIESLNRELERKDARNEELQQKVREFQIRPQELIAARQADGRIMLAKAGEEAVFINLGKDDHLTLGLRFAVYAPDLGIPTSGEAKGALEVVSIDENISECKIKWEEELNPIMPGDWIANPIYDRERPLSFMVIGAFDLDHDNFDDPYGRETIEAVIRESGGVIADELTARLDFIIVGARPHVRSLSDDASAEDVAVYEEQLARATEYGAILSEALSLSIPALTQETFLNFLAPRFDRPTSGVSGTR